MQKYLDKALLFDLIGCVVIGLVAYLVRIKITTYIPIPTNEVLVKFMDSIVKVATPLIGFLLTIVGIIVTFRNSFEGQKPVDETNNSTNNPLEPPTKSVFDKTISKKSQFYDTDMHKKVMKVFINSVYELGVVVFVFLGLQSGLVVVPINWLALITFLGFISVSMSVLRSFYIYRMFLNVHTKN